jgi:hypothetical protein
MARQAQSVEEANAEAKLSRLKNLLHDQGFFNDPQQRLLLFTEFKDTLNYLVAISSNGGSGSGLSRRDEAGSRDERERGCSPNSNSGKAKPRFGGHRSGWEGINLQVCHILFNYDIPGTPIVWNSGWGVFMLWADPGLPDFQFRRRQHHRRPGAPKTS